jgi:uncharacterized protein (TIGR02145 family)
MSIIKTITAIIIAVSVCHAQPISTNIIVKDIDGNVYHTVKIGKQLLTVENFKATKFNDGTPITYAKDSALWVNLAAPGYCYYKNKAPSRTNKKVSALYNWYAVASKKLAPAGWHVPSEAELDTLELRIFGNDYANSNTSKANGLIKRNFRWFKKSNFFGLPAGGCRYSNGSYREIGSESCWWSDSEFSKTEAFIRKIDFTNYLESRQCVSKLNGCSVRLIMDSDMLKKTKIHMVE